MSECPACGGEGVHLGNLGNLAHFSCRYCGTQFSGKDKRFTCPSCEYTYSIFNASESTTYEDHGVCWSCQREMVNGERCRNCYELGHTWEVCEENEDQ